MRSILRKLLSAALAAALLAAPLNAFASDALGHDLLVADTPLAAGTELAQGVFWSDSKSDFRRENYVVYTPSERVKPVVAYGETTRSLTTTLGAAKTLESRGWRVIAGINGDYYGVSHGVPLGSTMVDGVLRNANADPYYAVGFRADGSAVIGDPMIAMRADVTRVQSEDDGDGENTGETETAGETETISETETAGESETPGEAETAEGESAVESMSFPVLEYNHIRQSGYGVFLYDHLFNDRHTTGTSEPGVDVICSVEGGALSIGGSLTLRVEEVLPEATDTFVGEGKVVLTANLKAGESYTAPLLALRPDDQIALGAYTRSDNAAWNDVVDLIGAPELLVQDGAVREGLSTGSAPRTAIGLRADGGVILYTIDGRQSGYSIGTTLTAVGLRLVELGCVTAVALDGGGSTSLVTTLPNETAARVVNSPSDGSNRAVSNHVLLIAPNTPSGVPDHIYLAPSAHRALPGAQVALTAAVIDTNGLPMSADVAFAADAGALDGSTLTLPDTVGATTVTASAGELSATVVVDVLAPEWINVFNGKNAVSSIALSPGGSVSLTAKGYYNRLPLAGGNDSFTWRCEGEGVTLEGAKLIAGSEAALATLTVSCAGTEVSLPVKVAPQKLKTLDDFETAFEPVAGGGEASTLTLSRATDASRVRFGRASARLDYALDGVNAASVAVQYPLAVGYNCVELWAYGDGGAEALSILTDAGSTSAAALDFTGWQRLVFNLPAGAGEVTGFSLSAPENAAGTVWLDQFILGYDSVTDDTAPAVSLKLEEDGGLTGSARDNFNGTELARLTLACDGMAMEYSYDAATGALTAAAPAGDGMAHRVTLTAQDAAGNLSRASVTIPAAEGGEPAFPDVAKHWSADYVAYLKRSGISTGSGGKFHPDTNITRQEFAVMLYRYLSTEEDFSTVELPFADTDKIADWALPAVHAMYALGVTGGTTVGGKLCFAPGAEISRQEAMTMLGRMLEKGYAAPALAYADSESVPAWAEEHVRTLSALGVLGGYEDNTFRGANPLTRAQVAAVLFRMN